MTLKTKKTALISVSRRCAPWVQIVFSLSRSPAFTCRAIIEVLDHVAKRFEGTFAIDIKGTIECF